MHTKIDRLRDEVTFMSPGETKQQKYKEIFSLARDNGYFNRMVEVASFAGHKLSDKDYEVCLQKALERKDVKSFVDCKKKLGKGVSVHELTDLLSENLVPDLDNLLNIITTHIPQWKLSPTEWLVIESAKNLTEPLE